MGRRRLERGSGGKERRYIAVEVQDGSLEEPISPHEMLTLIFC